MPSGSNKSKKLLEFILSNLKNKILRDYQNLTPEAQKELARRLVSEVEGMANRYVGPLNLDVLKNLAQYGAQHTALPGAVAGGIGGAILTPDQEETNVFGIKQHIAPTIYDRLNNALTGAGLGAMLSGGAGAYAMREVAKKLQRGELSDDIIQALANRLGKQHIEDTINNSIKNYIRQNPNKVVPNAATRAFKSNKAKSAPASKIVSPFRDVSDVRGLLNSLFLRATQDKAKSVPIDPNAAMALFQLSSMTGIPVRQLIEFRKTPALLQAVAPAVFQKLNLNPAMAQRLKTLADLTLNNKFMLNNALLDQMVTREFTPYGIGAGGVLGSSLGGILGSMAAGSLGAGLGGPLGAGAGLALGKAMASHLSDVGQKWFGLRRAALDQALKNLAFGDVDTLARVIKLKGATPAHHKAMKDMFRSLSNELQQGKTIQNPLEYMDKEGPSMALYKKYRLLNPLLRGAGLIGAGGMLGAKLFGGNSED